MGDFVEIPLVFACGGERLVGIVSQPESGAGAIGVLIVVGGPQYRVGSHRQFALLARALAAAGFCVLRFDYRGMGDSSGPKRDFTAVQEDIAAAVGAFRASCPQVSRVVLWGLCDAAAAALLYWQETRDARIAGMCLLNPWVRSEKTLAATQVKHYYGRRILEPEFWRKLLSGKLAVTASLMELVSKLRTMRGGRSSAAAEPFQVRMAHGWRSFSGPLLLILSGDDYTAKEFLECAGADPAWSGLLERPGVRRCDVPGADHTFSNAAARREVEAVTLRWLGDISGQTTERTWAGCGVAPESACVGS